MSKDKIKFYRLLKCFRELMEEYVNLEVAKREAQVESKHSDELDIQKEQQKIKMGLESVEAKLNALEPKAKGE